ncbi:hypothetical protein MJO28_003436 [Puccinia striiformis f. sp. tritici]|uniref:Uncharacterized protein n=1 Tax=Puccinia striiformis f. sp. tritici TaxID=168172 RepID=A0ACC0EW81_9BASI|nr:hypothetical protein MJO28_003436 [Puccinia striiformis f. sp. tritici]
MADHGPAHLGPRPDDHWRSDSGSVRQSHPQSSCSIGALISTPQSQALFINARLSSARQSAPAKGARIRARYESAISHAVCAYTAVTSEQRSPSTLSFEANWPPLPPVAPTQEGLGVPRAPGTLERPADANHWRQGCVS